MVKREPNFDHFVQVLLRKVEPDWMPLSEFGIDWGVMAEIQGPPREREDQSAWLVRFWRDMGFHCAALGAAGLDPPARDIYLSQGVNLGFPHGTRIAEDTAQISHGTRTVAGMGMPALQHRDAAEVHLPDAEEVVGDRLPLRQARLTALVRSA